MPTLRMILAEGGLFVSGEIRKMIQPMDLVATRIPPAVGVDLLTAGRGKEIAMRVLGYTWAGVRTADLKSAARFFGDVLGLSLIHEGKGLAQFEMPSGQLFEVFDAESRYYRLHACPVLAFQVEDVSAARKELQSRGVEFVTDVEGNESEAWAYFRGPDGYLYELWQTGRPLKALPLP
jgi:catechol 2,3-dioxygenase-like lactoylglutathione lyase family enzyme